MEQSVPAGKAGAEGSVTFSRQLLLTSRFPGLMSRCRIPAECRYFRPEHTNTLGAHTSTQLQNIFKNSSGLEGLQESADLGGSGTGRP